MALTFVGANTGVAASSGAAISIDLTSLTGGSGSTAETGDIVLLTVSSEGPSTPVVSTSGYTNYAILRGSDTYDCYSSYDYKIMGATPDTSVGTTGGAEGCAAIAYVWRGVDQTTPMDVSPTTAVGANSNRIDNPAITPVTSGAVVVITGAGAEKSNRTVTTTPSGYSNMVEVSRDITNAQMVVFASKAWSGSGAEDPANWVFSYTSTSCSWTGATVALRPASAAGPSNLKTYNTNAVANIKTINTNAIANVKSLNTNT